MLFYSRKCLLLSLLVVVSLVLAALTPGVVYAEGDVPEVPPADTPVEAAAPEEDAGSVVEALAESGAAIVDAGGESVPLASQAALDVICEPDPWFYCSVGCPGGKSGFYATINDALAGWAAKKGYGYIFLESGYISDQAVTLVGTDPRMPTLKGIKWLTPTIGDKPQVNGLIDISKFIYGFTLWGISVNVSSISPAINIHENIGTIRLIDVDVTNSLGTGINIENRGSINLNDVTSSGNGFEGATLKNRYYHPLLLKFVSSGNISILNSTFDGNGYLNDGDNYPGLIVNSNGAVTLNGVSASGNYGSGAEVGAYGLALTIKNSVFSNNQDTPDIPDNGYGLVMYEGSPAAVILENVVLNGNDSDGAFLRTTRGITLNKVTASLNDLYGVRIEGFPGNIDNRAVGARNVTVLSSTFDGNYEANLSIRANGLVTVKKLTSVNAGRRGYSPLPYGLYINNTYFSSYPQGVIIQGATITNNYYKGVYVLSKRAITVSGIVSTGNGANGMYLKNDEDGTGGVKVSNLLGLNQFNGNTGVGLVVYTNGSVSMASVQANGNNEGGVSVHGNGLVSNVTMVNVETSGNQGVANTGLLIFTSGAVSLDKIISSDNKGEGIYIDNTSSAYARTVSVRNSTASLNGKEGVKVVSVGGISLYKVVANSNTLEGADLINHLTPLITQVPKGITVAYSTFDGNSGMGLYMLTQRGMTLNSIQASNTKANGSGLGIGVYAVNTSSTISSSVVIGGINHFDGNENTGLYVRTNGALTARGATASANGGFGVDAITARGIIMSAVQANGNTLGGVNLYDYGLAGNATLSNIETIGNLGAANSGLRIENAGAVVLYKITALQNAGEGIFVNNTASTIARQVRITYATASNNGKEGLKVGSVGPITLVSVIANENALMGADLHNHLTPHSTQVPQAVIVVRSTFDGNNGAGLYILSQRKITLNSVNASGNKADAFGAGVGVYAVNTSSTVFSPLVVTGINHFYSNASTGLYLESNGALTISGVTSSLNSGHGMQAITGMGALITTSQFSSNVNSGVVLNASAVVKISGVTISQNGLTTNADGLVITDLGGKVYIYKNFIIQNGGWGVNIDVLIAPTDVYISPYAVISENVAGDMNIY